MTLPGLSVKFPGMKCGVTYWGSDHLEVKCDMVKGHRQRHSDKIVRFPLGGKTKYFEVYSVALIDKR